VIGLGVADVKLDYLCKAFALRQVDHSRLKRPVHLLATFAEEVGLNGAKHFIANTALRPEWVLCGEPSELIPCHAHKGYAVARVTLTPMAPKRLSGPGQRLRVQGKAAHSSTPGLGVNAITLLLERLKSPHPFAVATITGGTSANTVPALAEAVLVGAPLPFSELEPCSLEGESIDVRPTLSLFGELWQRWVEACATLEPSLAPDFDPPGVVSTLGVMRGEQTSVSALFDARLLPEHDPQMLFAAFREAAARVVGPDHRLEIIVDRDNPGMRARADDRLIATLGTILAERGLRSTPRAKPTSTEAGVFARAGFSAAVFGPGVSTGNAHTANEWNRVADLEAAVPIYAALIERLCA
jgi:acetylornithine deacetylase/succinyl-diaminopimelate desuccinylase-like protein